MKYSYIIHTPEKNITVMDHVDPFVKSGDMTVEKDGFVFHVESEIKAGYTVTEITVSSDDEKEVYLSLYGEGEAELVSFSGLRTHERIFRQSPHDPLQCHFTMEKSAVPMVAAVKDGKADIFISDKIQKGIIKNA